MKKKRNTVSGIFLLMLIAAVIFTGCGTGGVKNSSADSSNTAGNQEEVSAEMNHGHEPASSAQMISDDEPGGYCGNTITKIRVPGGETYSFWGSDSVNLTDMLLHLDYSGDVCRCMPEYTVDTEFGSDYGINLTGFYARHDGRQAKLTEQQVKEIREIIDKNCVSRTQCYEE